MGVGWAELTSCYTRTELLMPGDQRKNHGRKSKLTQASILQSDRVDGCSLCVTVPELGLHQVTVPRAEGSGRGYSPLNLSCSLGPREKEPPPKGYWDITGHTRHGMGASVSWWLVFRTTVFSVFWFLLFRVQY